MLHNLARESAALRLLGGAVLLAFALVTGAAQLRAANSPALLAGVVAAILGAWLVVTGALRLSPAKLLWRRRA